MRPKLRRYTPLMIGVGALLLVLDTLTFVFRALGLERGAAIFLALLTLCAASALLTHHYFHKTNPKSRNHLP